MLSVTLYWLSAGNIFKAGADPGIFDWGGPSFGSERTVGRGGEINYSPTRHPDQSQLYVIILWSLILYK